MIFYRPENVSTILYMTDDAPEGLGHALSTFSNADQVCLPSAHFLSALKRRS